MTPTELRAISRLGGHAFAGLVSRIEQVHQAIGGRAFGSIGPVSAPVRAIHDFVARGAYRAVGSAGSAAGALGGEAASLVGAIGKVGATGQPGAGGPVLAVLNAVSGDRLGPDLAPLAIRMAVRADGRDVELTPQRVRDAFGDAIPRLAVFLHGLAETENAWLRQASRSEPYGRRLRAEFGYTPVYIRYNTGLARVRQRPRPGPAARRADGGVAGRGTGDPARGPLHGRPGYPQRLPLRQRRRRTVGAARPARLLPRITAPRRPAGARRRAGRWALSQVAETRPFADLLTGSAAIKDLRHGYILDDWAACDPGGCQHNHRRDVPLLPGVSHYAVSAVISANPESPLGTLVGDLLVQPASAHGRRGPRQHIPFSVEMSRRHGGMHHFDLLNHPDVWESMRSLLGSQPAGVTSAAGARS